MTLKEMLHKYYHMTESLLYYSDLAEVLQGKTFALDEIGERSVAIFNKDGKWTHYEVNDTGIKGVVFRDEEHCFPPLRSPHATYTKGPRVRLYGD